MGAGPRRGWVIPPGALALLIAIVLIAHIAVLTGVSDVFSLQSGAAPPAFQTRRIEPVPVAAAPRLPPAKPRQPARPVPLAPPAAAAPAEPPPAPPPSRAEPLATPVEPVPEPVVAESPAAETAQTRGNRQQEPQLGIPGSVMLRYDVLAQTRGLSYSAKAELAWRQDGTDYEAQLEVSALFLGSRRQTSVGKLTSAGLEPVRFSDRSRSERATHFRRDIGRITFSANTPSAPLEPGAQDQLSVFLQLASLLQGNPALHTPGQRISIQTATARDAVAWEFQVENEESLVLPLGTLHTLKLTRLPIRDFDQKIELWFAAEIGWMPVRIRLAQANGDFVDQQLRASDKL